jgi:hypothetical protein
MRKPIVRLVLIVASSLLSNSFSPSIVDLFNSFSSSDVSVGTV